ncbi:AI-2E family transporter [Candidatus Pacearchaeota archaeon]|nr:AI-2E family transporter [Candidatus Pacearchaeota archaeon]MBI2056698.1 AI-2E family transporter [Candidatus Pacearchaeota archaeon]
MEKEYFKNFTSTGIILILLVLSFFLLKPILLSIIIAIILGYLFYPLYKRVNKLIKSEYISALLMCILLTAIIFIPMWFLTPVLVNQSIQFYTDSQGIDFVTPLKQIFPDVFSSVQFSQEIGSVISSFVTKISNSLMNTFSKLISNFPILLLQFFVVFFVFFVVLKDQEKFVEYLRSLLPFSKDVENKLFKSSREITTSIFYGQIILGILAGIIVGISFYIFNVPNAFILTILAAAAGILPIIGTTIVWVPVVIYLFVTGSVYPAIGVILFGIFSSSAENFIKPIILAKWINLHPAVILIGMVGGTFIFGILGMILGPLILAYLLIILEIYRDKKTPGVFINPPQHVQQLN